MIEIRWHGRGGQGSFTVARMLGAAAVAEGKYAQAFPSFGPERRGAPVTGFTRIDTKKILNRSEAMQPDYVVVMDETLLGPAVTEGVKTSGTLLINTNNPQKYAKITAGYRVIAIDATSLALAALGRPISNVAMLAALTAASSIVGTDSTEEAIRESLSGVTVDRNIELFRTAYHQVKGGL